MSKRTSKASAAYASCSEAHKGITPCSLKRVLDACLRLTRRSRLRDAEGDPRVTNRSTPRYRYYRNLALLSARRVGTGHHSAGSCALGKEPSHRRGLRAGAILPIPIAEKTLRIRTGTRANDIWRTVNRRSVARIGTIGKRAPLAALIRRRAEPQRFQTRWGKNTPLPRLTPQFPNTDKR